jgi:hypothetical protein
MSMERSLLAVGPTDALSPIMLGAIAIGSCALAACEDPQQRSPIEPIVATSAVSEHEEEAPDEVQLEADAARLGSFDAAPGFTPDPITRAGTLAGGPFDAHVLDERCAGWIGAEPDYLFEASRPFAELAVMSASERETTLFIVDPEGETRCDTGAGDTGEEHAIVRGHFDAGLYRVWIGAEERGEHAPYVLAISELEDTVPSSLLH